MTKFYADLVSKLRTNEPAAKSAYYLFLLGTDVNFVPVPDEKEVAPYIRGETFSYAAQATAKLLGQEGVFLEKHADSTHENYAHAFHADSVDLINGANTLGDEAGDRIAKGLLLSLQAIAKGQTQINLSGFSRGAVEAIVLTHELERVKKALIADAASTSLPKKTLAEIICESNSVPSAIALFRHPSYTRQVLKNLTATATANDDEETLKVNLLTGLKQLEVNLFVLDPVPGGNFAKVARVGWQEPIFYTLPDFVTKKLELVQQHETSNCFKVIIPQGMPFEVIPGSHGTGDGNQFDDNGQKIEAEKTDVSAVQNLVLQRWIEFMSFQLDKDAELAQAELVPKHGALNELTQKYLQATAQERDKLLLASYEKIMENYPAFVFLAGRCYKGLGQLGPIRLVHYHQRGGIPISDIHQHGDAKLFVNTKHVELWISQQIAEFNFFDKPLEEQIAWLKNNIADVFQAAAQIEGANAPPTNKQLQKILDMTEKKDQAALLLEALATLSNTLILTYLRNHLSEEQLSICHTYFDNTIKILRDASANQQLSEAKRMIAHKFKMAVEQGLTTNLHQHSRALLLQTQKQFEDSTLLLEKLPEHDLNQQEQALIRQTTIEGWLISTQQLLGELSSLSEQIDRLIPYCDQTDMLKALQELTTSSIYTTETKEIPELSQKLHSMVDQSIVLLKTQAANLLKDNPQLLNKQQAELSDDFFQEIRLLAKGMGAELAEDKVAQQKLETIKETLEATQEALDSAQQALATTKETLGTTQEALDSAQQELGTTKEMLGTTQEALDSAQQELGTTKEMLGTTQEALDSVQQELGTTKEMLEVTQEARDSAQQELAQTQKNLGATQETLETTQKERENTKEELKKEQEENANLQEQILQMQQAQELSATEAMKSLQAQLLSAQAENEQLQAQIALDKDQAEKASLALQEQLQQKQVDAQQMQKNLDNKEEQIVSMHELLKNWQHPEEQQALIKITQLQETTNAYLAHLTGQKTKTTLLDEKITAVSRLKDILDTADKLPSKRLNSFQEQLRDTEEKLKEHRDPRWQRFFRDCFRIVGLLVSGVALARVVTGRSAQFFRPSEGDNYVENTKADPKPPTGNI